MDLINMKMNDTKHLKNALQETVNEVDITNILDMLKYEAIANNNVEAAKIYLETLTNNL